MFVMRTLNLPLARLKSLILAADVRFVPTDYINDHIWELSVGPGDPAGLSLSTTFGLRARSFRIFPRFIENRIERADPRQFESQPHLHQIYPNFALITFAPFTGIDVIWETWVPDSHSIAARFTIQNNGVITRNLHFDLLALLSPGSEGHRMVGTQMAGSMVLSGHTEDLFPVVFLTGGASLDPGPLPALAFDMTLLPGTVYQTTMIQAALESEQASFEKARLLATLPWDAEKTRIEIGNAEVIEITTENQDWDELFTLGQQKALQLLVGPTDALPHPSLILSRDPDLGYSPRKDGSDYNHLWNGQTPLHIAYLGSILLPAAPHFFEGLLHNYIFTQNPDSGYIDWKPGLAGQRSLLMATPILANLTWIIFEVTRNRSFLEESFQPLYNFLMSWFSLRHDQDEDGIPEWDHPAQLGFEEHPLFGTGGALSPGADISAIESPALCALLYQECRALIKIAETVDRLESIPTLAAHAENLRAAVDSSWDEHLNKYHAWDRDSHLSLPGEFLGQHEGNGSLPLRRILEQPARLVLHIHSTGIIPPRPVVSIYGQDQSGKQVERIILPERWQWFLDNGSVTTNDLFSTVDSIRIQGLESNDSVMVYRFNSVATDLSLQLPLYAQLPSPAQARQLIEHTLLNPDQFWKPFGLPACADDQNFQSPGTGDFVLLIWNTWIGEAFLKYGYRARAAELFTHLMSGIIQTFNQNGEFVARHSALDGAGRGEVNALEGLPPIGLFLDILGVKIFSPWKVHLEGSNPFPWPVRLKYRGLTIIRQTEKTNIIFPDRQVVTIEDPAPCTISART
jgi:hypothetical protein